MPVIAKSLEVSGLRKSYRLRDGRVAPAVRDFTLTVAPGEFVTLLGPSGCGKTTVLRTLAGLEEADAGTMLLDGRSIGGLPAHRRRIGMVFQSYALFPHMTVFENVAYSLRIRSAPKTDVARDVPAALAAVGLEELATRLPGQLSGGQQQRVAVARALVMQPDLLLFDEPLSNLDAKLRVQVRGELRRLQKRLGTTALYVTHDQDEAMSLSDRVCVMRAGEVEQVGTPEEVYARPATLSVAEFVGQVNAVPGRVVSRADGIATVDALGCRMAVPDRAVGIDVTLLLRPEAIRLGSPAEGVPGVVEEVDYRGDRVEYRVDAGGARLTAVETALARTGRAAPGDAVGLVFAAHTAHLLAREEALPADTGPDGAPSRAASRLDRAR